MTLSTALEHSLIDIIRQAPIPGETAHAAHARKELELTSILSQLSAVESLFLHRRLTAERMADPLVEAFQRLMPERRCRLLAFVADARRRAAHAKAISVRAPW